MLLICSSSISLITRPAGFQHIPTRPSLLWNTVAWTCTNWCNRQLRSEQSAGNHTTEAWQCDVHRPQPQGEFTRSASQTEVPVVGVFQTRPRLLEGCRSELRLRDHHSPTLRVLTQFSLESPQGFWTFNCAVSRLISHGRNSRVTHIPATKYAATWCLSVCRYYSARSLPLCWIMAQLKGVLKNFISGFVWLSDPTIIFFKHGFTGWERDSLCSCFN